jgi:O-antigen/teichoic acid export membrane protein
VSFVILLVIGWFFNTLIAPAYFANLGIGELSWNVIGHVTIGVLNIILGLLLGVLYNGIGVVIAWVVSLAFGSSIIILSYHITHEISLTKLLPESSRIIIAASLFGILTGIITHYKLNNILNAFLLNSIIIFLFAIIVFIPFWIHPMRKLLIEWINGILFKKEKEMH